MASLVIGYGNDLRSDDGAGRVVADRIEAMGLPDVRVRSVTQLTPELALEIAEMDRVVFVDASTEVATTSMSEVAASPPTIAATNHYASPESLLDLVRTTGFAPPPAITVSIPVTDLGLGLELTPMTELGVEEAVAMIVGLVTE